MVAPGAAADIVASTPLPDSEFMKQAGLEPVAFDDGFLREKTHLIMDRDTRFTEEFRSVLKEHEGKAVRVPDGRARGSTGRETLTG